MRNQPRPRKRFAQAWNGLPGESHFLAVALDGHRIRRTRRQAVHVIQYAMVLRRIHAVDGDNFVARAQLPGRALWVDPTDLKLAKPALPVPPPMASGRVKPDVEAGCAIDQQQGEE